MAKSGNAKIFVQDEYAAVFNGHDLTLRVIDLASDTASPDKDNTNRLTMAETLSPARNTTTNSMDNLPRSEEHTLNDTTQEDKRPVLQRLTLNVSNTCNLTCRYCYANGGYYYSHGSLMSARTGINVVNFASRNFAKVELINFFGGEPTLNPVTIEAVCEYVAYLHSRGTLPYFPRFGLTTNGYVIGDRMLGILRKYDFSVSISLDGPKVIHDRLRVARSGSQTYDAIEKNVFAIIEQGITPEFECTYTAEHWRTGFDIVTLMDYFYDRFHCRTLHCPTVITESGSHWFVPLETASELYIEAIRCSIRNLACGIPKSISIATRLLNSLETQIPIWHYCPAGQASLTVNADGNIYACFLLMKGKGFCLGNVNGMNRELWSPISIGSLLKDADKWRNTACMDCWAQSLCFGCLGEDLARVGPEMWRSAMTGQSDLCDYKRNLIETFLISVAGTRLNPPSYSFGIGQGITQQQSHPTTPLGGVANIRGW